MEPFIGQIQLFGFNFVPRGWAFCGGQLLSIQQNTALFSLLGTIYGGDGRTTFGLPDLRGRVPIQGGQGPGLRNHRIGERGGVEQVTLNVINLPSHHHEMLATSGEGTSIYPGGHLATDSGQAAEIYSAGPADRSIGSTTDTGNGAPIENLPPYLVLNYCIALEGIFPSRG